MHLRFYRTLTGLVALLTLAAIKANAQTPFFERQSTQGLRVDASMTRNIKNLSFYKLQVASLRSYLAKAPREFTGRVAGLPLQIPLPDGSLETFIMLDSPVLAPQVAAKHPDIKTYNGQGQIHKNYTVRLSLTALGFNAIVLGLGQDAAYYEKASTDLASGLYRVYLTRDAERPIPTKAFGQGSKCAVLEKTAPLPGITGQGRQAALVNSTGETLRTFRLAIAATGEFTQQAVYGGNVDLAFAGVVGYVNRLNAVYRNELSVALTLVSDVSAVYADPDTDPYTNSDQEIMLEQNQTNVDNLIGTGNYDVGHVFSFEGSSGGGIAARGSVCDGSTKAQGVSGVGDGSFAPIFDDQLVAHEIGHQFGMTHSYNSTIPVCTTRRPDTSVEPGAGTTIMSYGFTCDGKKGDDNYESSYQPFLNFHTVNYDQAQLFINTLSCFTSTSNNNIVPVITQLPTNTAIPKSTPFALTGAATDGDDDALTYSWEGTNVGTIVPDAKTLANTAQPPFFRSYEPVATGTRTFPRLGAILDGTNYAIGDKLPSVGIATTHRLVVRDNFGGVTYQQVTVTVAGNSGPFLETTNLAKSYAGGTAKTITWSVANTTAAPVNCAMVTILLSTDGGVTFPITLAANTPNDGSQSVTFPNVVTTRARIKVASSNNIFFDISNKDFSLTAPCSLPAPTLSSLSRTVAVSGKQLSLTDFVTDMGNPLSFSGVEGEIKSGKIDVSQPGQQSFTVTQSSKKDKDCVSPLTTFTITVGTGTARQSALAQAGEEANRLSVRVLGNPIQGANVEVEVRGAVGQFLRLAIVDAQGRSIVVREIVRAEVLERHSLNVSRQPPSLLLLQVSTPTQQQVIKLLKP